MSKRDGFGHESPNDGKTNDWITPRPIIRAFDLFGQKYLHFKAQEHYFDLDPCQSKTQPWPCASSGFTVDEDGLRQPWVGTVWCNPPYGRQTSEWIERLAQHDDGVALVFARTDTRWWQDLVFPFSDSVLFLKSRVRFARPNVVTPNNSAGAPSALIAFGEVNTLALKWLIMRGLLEGALTETTNSSIDYQSLTEYPRRPR